MHARVVCECGNEVNVPAEQANAEYRCQRCGRRVFANDDDARAFFDIGSSVDGEYQTPISIKRNAFSASHDAHLDPEQNALLDSDETIIQSSLTPLQGSGKHGAGNQELQETGATSTLLGGSPRPNSRHDDFDVAPRPLDGGSSLVWPAEAGTPKYDLSQRVMRPIAKPVLPAIPYSGGGEYGIHRILRIHQRGGMGRILVAYDQYLKRDVAIKELHPDVAEDESIVRRFIGEAEITAQLEHPGVVPIHRLGQGHDGLPYYTMKMIKGETLQDAIKAYHRKPSQGELLSLVRRLVSVAKTMAFAHSKGVIHRDLKPANIMIGEHGETLVMDWGLAKPFNQGIEDTYISIVHRTKQPRPELTMVGAIVGTPAFMSPEQAMAEENMVGPLSDVFSLGTILYYLLAGQTAFSGRSTQEVLNKVRAAVVTPPSQIKSNVPHDLEQICLKAMAKLPENRYQGAAEFSDDLCRWLDGEPVIANKASAFTRSRRWLLRHRSLSIGLPCVLSILILWTCLNVWGSGWLSGAAQETGHAAIPREFSIAAQVEGSPGTTVWTEYRPTGELLISCQIETLESHTNRVVSILPPPGTAWNLTARQALSFSLLTIPDENYSILKNFSIRLEQGESYEEYMPGEQLWNRRNRTDWQHFTIPLVAMPLEEPLPQESDDWHCEVFGSPDRTKIDRLEIRFETDSEMILNIDNLAFSGDE